MWPDQHWIFASCLAEAKADANVRTGGTWTADAAKNSTVRNQLSSKWMEGRFVRGVVLPRRARYVVDNHFLAVSWHVCRLINPSTILKALSWFLPVHAFGTIKSHLDGTCNFVGSSISARLFTFQSIYRNGVSQDTPIFFCRKRTFGPGHPIKTVELRVDLQRQIQHINKRYGQIRGKTGRDRFYLKCFNQNLSLRKST